MSERQGPFCRLSSRCATRPTTSASASNRYCAGLPANRIEVLVVDGDSDDASRDVVARYARDDARVRLLHNPKRIVPTALNIGIRAARGEMVVRVDAHTTLSPDYMREGVAALQRSGAENVGGPMVARGGGRIGDAIALAMSSRFGIGAYFHFGTEERSVDTVYMGMWPRAVFSRVGLFDEELVRNQDDEFNYRLRKMGGKILLVPARCGRRTRTGGSCAPWRGSSTSTVFGRFASAEASAPDELAPLRSAGLRDRFAAGGAVDALGTPARRGSRRGCAALCRRHHLCLMARGATGGGTRSASSPARICDRPRFLGARLSLWPCPLCRQLVSRRSGAAAADRGTSQASLVGRLTSERACLCVVVPGSVPGSLREDL